jgi:hypothetical protein
MASAKIYYAEKGEENGFQDKITKLFTQRMTTGSTTLFQMP